MASLYIYKLKINAKLQEKTFARWDMSIHHVPTVSCVNLKVKVLFSMFWSVVMVDLRQQRIKFSHVLKLSKLINSSTHYQNSSDMRFLRAGRLYFIHDVFSCVQGLLIIYLSKTTINFIYVNITYVYVTLIY